MAFTPGVTFPIGPVRPIIPPSVSNLYSPMRPIIPPSVSNLYSPIPSIIPPSVSNYSTLNETTVPTPEEVCEIQVYEPS